MLDVLTEAQSKPLRQKLDQLLLLLGVLQSCLDIILAHF